MTKKAGSKQPSRSHRKELKSKPTSVQKSDSSKDRETRIALLASDKLYYRIGEVSELTGVKAHVLRYWETEFRWMAPPKSRSKQRLYRQRDIEFVLLVKRLLWEERYTIAGARQRIQELGVEDALAMLSEPREADRSPDTGDSADWISFRAAIDEMRDELVAVRGVLREGM